MQIKDLTKKQLWQLRQQICLNSLFIRDYENSFGIDAKECYTFFDGYVDYLTELANSDYGLNLDLSVIFELYDNADNLYDWLSCIE